MNTSATIPELLVPWLKPEAAGHLRCSQVSEREFRVEILDDSVAAVPGPLAMMGYARQFNNSGTSTDDIMKELRAGDRD